MKFAFKVVLLFLIIFNFLVPYVHYSCTVAVIIAAFYYFFTRSFPLKYFVSRYIVVILVGTLFIAFFDVVVVTLHANGGTGFFARFMVEGWMLACLVFVLPILIDSEETASNESMTIICYAFALQGLIHTLAVMIPAVGDFVIQFTSKGYQAAAGSPMQGFRFYSLTGAPIFDLPAAYGVAHIVFFRLQLVPDQNYLRGWKAFAIMFFMIMGTILSGRTGFVGFGLGLAFYLIYNLTNVLQILKNLLKIAGGFLCVLALFFTVLTPRQRSVFVDMIFPFAFEAYYNWRDTGQLRTASTDALENVHYFPLDTSTVLWGDGVRLSKYPSTDAGYMNHLMVGGIFYLLLLILYQLFYFWQPMNLAREEHSRDGDINFFYFLLLFIHMFILEYKGAAIGQIHIVEVMLLYIGISYLSEQYALEEEDSIEEQLVESAYA